MSQSQAAHRLYVAGVDYEYPRGGFRHATSFRAYADRRAQSVIDGVAAGSEEYIEVHDALTGEVATTEVLAKNGKKIVTKRVEQRYERVSEKSFVISAGGAPFFRPEAQPRAMSIVDVYSRLAKIGEAAPRRLLEFSVFSHGAMSGPILLNTYARDDLTQLGLRDPRDRDGRSTLDFTSPNTSAEQRDAMRKAFATRGYAWMWGCNFPRVFNKLLNRIENSPKYSQSVSSDTLFEFDGLEDEEIGVINDYLLPFMGAPVKGRKAKLRFRWLKHLCCASTALCYSYQFARAVGITTYGALVGTYAEFDGGNPPLMKVAGRFTRRFEFYRRHLGIQRDPEGRNYGRYEPLLDCGPRAGAS